MGAEAAAQPWAGGGRTRGSERLVLRSLGVCPQLRPGAERFGGAGEARATRLRCAERARSSERLLASVTSPWAKRRGGGGRGRFTAAGASVLRCGAPRLPRLTSRSPGFCGAPAVLSGVGASPPADTTHSGTKMMKKGGDTANVSKLAARFTRIVFKEMNYKEVTEALEMAPCSAFFAVSAPSLWR